MEPTKEELEKAPLLDPWCRAGRRVAGVTWGHERFPDQTMITTPTVQASGEGWIRTRNTLYRLGRDARADEVVNACRGVGVTV